MRPLARRLAGVMLASAVASGLLLGGERLARADATPEQLQFAAQEHDLGYRAYVAKQYDEAATHFENAFFAAPNPAELRSAIRARTNAGQPARAATLAAIGKRKFASDAALNKLADETIAAATPKAYQVHVTSAEECNVAVDAKVVAEEKATDFRLFVDPGHHELVVGWSEGRTQKVPVDATAGGSRELALTPPPIPVKKPEPVAGPPAPPPSSKPFGPAVFIVGAGLTAVGAGVTVWSGIDTINNPGTAAVKAQCVGQGTSCPAYQQGVSNQNRTTGLIIGTSVVGGLTAIVGIFLTQWSHPSAPGDERAATSLHVVPVVGPGEAALVGTF